MKRYGFLFLPAILGLASYCLAEERTKEKSSHFTSTLKYLDPAGDGYLTLRLFRGGKIVRTLHAEMERGGVFDDDEFPLLSPDGNFILINQMESAKLDARGGPIISRRAYCTIVDIRSGCIVVRDTGQFCGGEFTSDGKWKAPVYPELDLAAAAPNANAYVTAQLKPADSPETSFDNLLACDQPDHAQREALLHALGQ